MKIKTSNILLIILFLMLSSLSLKAHYIIVNSSNPISKISKGELRNIFIGNTVSWKNNKKVQIVDYNSESELREEFSLNFLNLSPNKVSMIWLKVTLSGKVSPPKIFFKERDVLKYVSENVEAIGYIANKKDLPADVKIVEVEN